ncbi:MAG: ribonuclease PH [Clostridia bacterium]|nr:ribonuclease PH [Clostridia bacterium]
MARFDLRENDQLRKIEMQTDFIQTAAGSCLISFGNTRVLCTASLMETTAPFLRGTGKGWLTAEYAMLPGSTPQRKARDGVHKDGRSIEIQRLIGRSLRAVIDLDALGERSIYIDCDVLQADGGTRTASITGGFVALCCAIDRLIREGQLEKSPIHHQIAAVSVGIVDNELVLDLPYAEDSNAMVDMNIVMLSDGTFVELQGTGEGRGFSREEMDTLLNLGQKGISELFAMQKEALGDRSYVIGENV